MDNLQQEIFKLFSNSNESDQAAKKQEIIESRNLFNSELFPFFGQVFGEIWFNKFESESCPQTKLWINNLVGLTVKDLALGIKSFMNHKTPEELRFPPNAIQFRQYCLTRTASSSFRDESEPLPPILNKAG
ncbi:hypothetical protein ACQKQC_24885 [Vibrio fortis]|uniref:hypothetical protein n=1 Tax=Vibrio fortis TaxID=212667 RepID=UPI0040691FED